MDSPLENINGRVSFIWANTLKDGEIEKLFQKRYERS